MKTPSFHGAGPAPSILTLEELLQLLRAPDPGHIIGAALCPCDAERLRSAGVTLPDILEDATLPENACEIFRQKTAWQARLEWEAVKPAVKWQGDLHIVSTPRPPP